MKIGKKLYKQIINNFQTIIYHLFDLTIDWDDVELCYIFFLKK